MAKEVTSQFQCGVCEIPFQEEEKLNSHILSSHLKTQISFGGGVSKMEYLCKVCNISFTLKREAENHFQTAHGDEVKNKDTKKKNLSSHYIKTQVWYDEEKRAVRYLCKICNFDFESVIEVETHIETLHEIDERFEEQRNNANKNLEIPNETVQKSEEQGE